MKCPSCGLVVFESECVECKRRFEYYKCRRCGTYWRNPSYEGEPTPLEYLSPPLRASLERVSLSIKENHIVAP